MPTIDIPDKICSHCGGTKWYKRNLKSNYFVCYKKLQETHKKYYIHHQEECKTRTINNWNKIKNIPGIKEKASISRIKWGHKNPDKIKIYKKNNYEKIRENLEDPYVKRLIIQYTSLKLKDIPQELIELKRKKLLLTRKSKQKD
jgi:hypothetical protein